MIIERQAATRQFLGETHRELVLLNKCFLLVHRIGTDTDDQNIGTLIYVLL